MSENKPGRPPLAPRIDELERRIQDLEQFILDQHAIGKCKATMAMKARHEEFLEYLWKKVHRG